jgi:hypothetical protein
VLAREVMNFAVFIVKQMSNTLRQEGQAAWRRMHRITALTKTVDGKIVHRVRACLKIPWVWGQQR